MKRTIGANIISFVFIFLFVYAAASKLIDHQNFAIQLGQSPLLTAYAEWISWLVPLAECVTVVLLVNPKTRLVGFYGSLILMSAFTAYIICILTLSIYVPCSCGGVLESLTWTQHLILNIGLVLSAIAGILLANDQSVFNVCENKTETT